MSDISEDILMSYFPDFLDEKMLRFVELKFKLEEKVGILSEKFHKEDIRKRRVKRHTHRDIEEKFKHIEREDVSCLFWSQNVNKSRVMAKEIREKVSKIIKLNLQVKDMIKKTISQQAVKMYKKVYIKKPGSNKPTDQFKWVLCDKDGNEIDPNNSGGESPYSSPTLFKRNSPFSLNSRNSIRNKTLFKLQSFSNFDVLKKNESYGILNNLNEITLKEIDRIHELYMKKEFTIENCVNLYKTLLLLFDDVLAAKEISRFFTEINVSLLIFNLFSRG